MAAQEMPAAKYQISVAIDPCGHWDFGNFDSKDKIEISREEWLAYLDAREEFETKHQELILRARRKGIKPKSNV